LSGGLDHPPLLQSQFELALQGMEAALGDRPSPTCCVRPAPNRFAIESVVEVRKQTEDLATAPPQRQAAIRVLRHYVPKVCKTDSAAGLTQHVGDGRSAERRFHPLQGQLNCD